MVSSESEQLNRNTLVVVVSDHITSQLGDESVILSVNDGMYYGLDALGTLIWGLLERPRGVSEVCEIIREKYEVDPLECEQAVLALLRDLIARGLVKIHQ